MLVLSKLAGSTNELYTPLQLNPHDTDGIAQTIAIALSMPLTERRMRWEAMMAKLRGHTVQQWFADFTDALRECQLDREELALVIAEPALWPLRSVTNGGARYH